MGIELKQKMAAPSGAAYYFYFGDIMGRIKKTVQDQSSSSPSSDFSFADALSKRLKEKKSDAHVYRIEDESGSVITRPKFLSTQILSLDRVLGGGIPAGRVVELYSKSEGEGKSSVASHIMAEMTRQGGYVLLIDSERGFTEDRLKTFGVDLNRVIMVEPRYIEEVFDIITETIETAINEKAAERLLVVWDSVASTPSKIEFEAEYDEVKIATQARSLSRGLPRLLDTLSKVECFVVFINQTRTNIGQMFGDNLTTVGGKALKFYSSVRLELSKGAGSKINVNNEQVGINVSAQCVKNRIAKPFNKTAFPLHFEKGVDLWKDFFDLLVSLKILDQRGAWYAFASVSGEEIKFQQKAFKETMKGLSVEDQEALADTLEKEKIGREPLKKFLSKI